MDKTEQQVKPVTAWAVVDGNGEILQYTIRPTDRYSIRKYCEVVCFADPIEVEGVWDAEQRLKGVRVVKVQIMEVKQND